MTAPTDRVLSRPIPTIFQDTAVFSSHGKQVVSAVLKKTTPRASLFGGMERWIGMVEWNSGME